MLEKGRIIEERQEGLNLQMSREGGEREVENNKYSEYGIFPHMS